MADSPMKEIAFGEAPKASLDNYALLKEHVGGLAADEYLQLKLVVDLHEQGTSLDCSSATTEAQGTDAGADVFQGDVFARTVPSE